MTNNKTSLLVSEQLPFFVREDNQTFVDFMKAYYEFLEQSGGNTDVEKSLQTYYDIDQTIDEFAQKLYNEFLEALPNTMLADKNLVLKHVLDFYRAKGTEKSVQFILRAVFGQESTYYYPKNDILRVSDGKWYIEKALRVTATQINGVANNNIVALNPFVSKRIVGNTSNASATVERISRYFQFGKQIDELTLSSVSGVFENGETIFTIFSEEGTTKSISSNVFGGIITTISITNSGSDYHIGDPVIFVSNTGSGACATISSVTSGNLISISVINGGAGFKVSDNVLVSGGGGSGALANVSQVLADNSIHSSIYTIYNSQIALEANTQLGNSVYTNLNSSNANTALQNALSSFVYSNTGPAQLVLVINPGSNYSSVPNLDIQANTIVRGLGILGRMQIISGGSGYANGDNIKVENTFGSYGVGAAANVKSVDGSGKITGVQFTTIVGFPPGGIGYNQTYLPHANVVSANGVGANVIFTATLGDGETLIPAASLIGGIETITITSGGLDYLTDTTIDLTHSGDGKATANATIVEGVITYPGRYLNDDGFLSSYNFLEDRDYYQNFSYVVRIRESINYYRKLLKDVINPAGMKVFGQYISEDETNNTSNNTIVLDTNTIYRKGTYISFGNVVMVNINSHSYSTGNTVYVQFNSGDTANISNGIYTVTVNNANSFNVITKKTSNTSGNAYSGLFT